MGKFPKFARARLATGRETRLDLRALHEDAVREVELPSGRVVRVHPPTRAVMRKLMQLTTPDELWDIARAIVPDITDAELDQLTPPMIEGLVSANGPAVRD